MQTRYSNIEDLLSLIEVPNGQACRELLEKNLQLFRATQGSTQNHQAWRGGYYDHVQEVMNLVVVLYQTLDALRPLPFSLSDALLVSFLHDLEKPWGYTLRQDGSLERSRGLVANSDQHAFRMRIA
jgi:23S rRNA maturation-related 3'-5' exoribonuclease YhaM